MFGAFPLTPPRAKLTIFHIAVESHARMHAIQRLLRCVWTAALSRVDITTVIDGQSFVNSIAYDNQEWNSGSWIGGLLQTVTGVVPLTNFSPFIATGYVNPVLGRVCGGK